MPFYRYECGNCGEQFRVLHRNGDDTEEVTKCPHCGSAEVERLLPRIGVIYKGSGYYNTDYRNKRTKPAKSTKGDGETPATDAGHKEPEGTKTKADQSES